MPIVNNKRYNVFHILVITFVWVLIFAIPLLFGSFPEDNDWNTVFKIWKDYSLLFLLFLFNHFVLLPLLFFKQRKLAYFFVATLMISVFFFLIYESFKERMPERLEIEAGMPPRGMHPSEDAPFHDRPPRPHVQAEKPQPNEAYTPQGDSRNESQRPPRRALEERRVSPSQRPDAFPMQPGGLPEPGIPPVANLLIFAVLLLGFDTGLSISMKWMKDEKKRVELERENTENKLIFLRQQVSPHFFMNTLNNIHALIDIDQEQAKESVIKLSHLMNYLIYDTQDGKVMLKDEMAFIESYIELMQLRFSDKVKLEVQIPSIIPKIEISPLLFISFIENAFKYGISYLAPSFVKIVFSFDNKNLEFVIDNSIHPQKEKREKSGFGIENTRKRLELIYNSDYKLNIVESAQQFTVKLKLPL